MGVLPLIFASGPGSEARRDISTGVFFGMMTAILVGILFVPYFFVWIYRLKMKRKKKQTLAPAPVSAGSQA